jgi:hypothetical protein
MGAASIAPALGQGRSDSFVFTIRREQYLLRSSNEPRNQIGSTANLALEQAVLSLSRRYDAGLFNWLIGRTR